MKLGRFEIGLAGMLAVFCAFVWHWQAPGRPLKPAEVDAYIARIDRNVSAPSPEKAQLIANLRTLAVNDDGKPVYMVNLMRYHAQVDPHWLPKYGGTPKQANAFYESVAKPIALRSGAFPIYAGNVREANAIGSEQREDHWSRVLVMRYPSRRAFFDLISDPQYGPNLPYKMGALHLALVPTSAELVLPDLRLAVVTLSLLLFLLVGWTRASRSNAIRKAKS